MNVEHLQEFLRSLSQPLSTSGAKTAAADLDRVCAGLEPFCAWGIAQFADFLVTAEEYARTGVVPTTGRAKSASAKTGAKAADPQALARTIEEFRAFYDRVTSPEVTYSAIEAEIKRLDKLKKDDLLEIAKAIGISAKLKTKKDAVVEIQRLMKERKESFERTRF